MQTPKAPLQQLGNFGHALAGALGGVFSNAIVYPLDTVKTRIQATDDRKGKRKANTLSMSSLLLKILEDEGIGGYYKGFGASMLNTFSMQYAYFFFYNLVRGSYLRRVTRALPKGSKVPPLSTVMELLLGTIAGALAQVFTIPVSVIATRQQLSDGGSSKHPRQRDQSFLGVGREIIREDGVMGLWTGIKPGLVLTVNPAITYGAYERLKSATGHSGAKISPWMAFALGAVSKTIATVVTYPYIMAKVRMQARPKEYDAEAGEIQETGSCSDAIRRENKSAFAILRRVLKEQGLSGWYQGMGAQITKAVLSQALLFMLKDQFERYTLAIIIFCQRLSLGM